MRTTTAPRPRTLAALLVLGLGGSLLLAACTGSRSDDEVEPPQTPTFHELTVPGDAVPTGVQVGDVSVLGGMGGSSEVPVLVVGKRAVARELPRLAVWSAAAGTQITDEPQLLETVGAPVEVDLDGDPDLSAVAGYSWRAGVEAPYLFTSTDRSRWEQVEIPADLAGLRPVQVAVDGDTTYVLGIDTDDRLAGLRVADGTVEPLDLPKTQDVASVTAAEASGGVLVLATAPSSGTGDGPEIFTSTDGTKTWARSALGAGTTVSSATVASRGDELVLVGSAYDDRTERWTLAAWSSHEGESWPRDSAYEDLFPEDGPDKGSWFGEGTIVGDRLVAPVSIESSTQFLLVNRKADARWVGELDDEALQTDGTSREARQLAPSVQVSVTGDGPALTVVRGNGTAHFYDAELKYLGVLGAVTPWFRPLQTDDFRDGAPLPGVRTVFTDLGEDGWRSVGQTTQYVLEDDALVTSDDGAAPASDRRVIAGADPGSGQEVALYTGWDPDADTIVTTPWSRPLDGVWTQGVGFDEEFAAASTLVRTDDRWIAAGSRAESMNVDDLRHAAAWTSTDGIRWQDAGTLRSGPRGSDVAGACVLPTGEAVVVGSVDTGLIDEPVTWTSDGDTWTRRILDVGGDGSGHAERCLATDDGVTVFVDAGGRTQVFATQDGETIAKTWVAPEGTSLDSVVSWGESVVSAGWLDGAQYTGPVLRISREPAAPGPAWDWVPVPTRSRSGVTVHLQDDTLVVTTSDDAGVQAWRVDDVYALLARARPADDA